MSNHRIVRLAVENIMKIKTAEIAPDGNVIVVGGKNAQGKTSLIESIVIALGGERVAPAKPIRDGEERAEIVLETEDLVVTRTFTAGGSYLTVANRDGAIYKTPQSILNTLYSGLTFDPLAFSRMKPDAQAETLRQLVGLDFTEHDARRQAVYDERRDVNRDAKTAAVRAATAPVHPEAPAEPVSIDELVAELEGAEAVNRAADNVLETIEESKDEIADAKLEISNKRAEIKQLELEIKKLEGCVAEMTRFLEQSPVPEQVDTEPIRQRIREAETVNAQVRENEVAREIDAESGRLAEFVNNFTATLNELDERKAATIEAANFPIDGLAFDGDGVSYEGVPFSQCSSAEQLRVSVAMGLAMNPELRVLLIRDGSLLDDDNLAMIADLATEHDAQVWIERVGEGEECSVILVDGAIKTEAVES